MAPATIAAVRARGPRIPAVSVIGFSLIWAFLILFVLYPLTRIFYDAFSNEAGQFTLVNFQDFFTDRSTCARSGIPWCWASPRSSRLR